MRFGARMKIFLCAKMCGKPPFLKVKRKNKKICILWIVYETQKLYIVIETIKRTQYIVFFDKNRSLYNV